MNRELTWWCTRVFSNLLPCFFRCTGARAKMATDRNRGHTVPDGKARIYANPIKQKWWSKQSYIRTASKIDVINVESLRHKHFPCRASTDKHGMGNDIKRHLWETVRTNAPSLKSARQKAAQQIGRHFVCRARRILYFSWKNRQARVYPHFWAESCLPCRGQRR